VSERNPTLRNPKLELPDKCAAVRGMGRDDVVIICNLNPLM
jgi:hypothetical protein